MEILTPYVVDNNESPLFYHHPYLVCRDATDSIVVLSLSGALNEPPQSVAVLEGRIINPSCYYLPSRYLVSFDQVDMDSSVILVHCLTDGRLLDHKRLDVLQARLYDTDIPPSPEQGECTPLCVSNGHITVWRNGAHAADGCIEVYRLSDAGKLTMLAQFHTPDGAPALAIRNIGYEYLLPDPVHLTPQYLIGSISLHPSPTVHLVRWPSMEFHASSSTTMHVELTCTRPSTAGIVFATTLQEQVFIPELDQLILAHYEYPLDFVDNSPVTAIRSIDPNTLSVNWCTSINRKVEQLYYHTSLSVLVTIGWTFDPNRLGITVLDACTGQVKREDHIGDQSSYKCGGLSGVAGGVQCGMTPSVDEIVAVFGDGQFSVSLLSDFIARGFVKRDILVDGQGENVMVLVTTPFPEIALSTPHNAKQRRAKANGSWHWVDRAFVGDGKLIIKLDSISDFIVLRWR